MSERTDDEKLLWEQVEIGIEAQRFVEGRLAQRMIFECENERRELCDSLATLDCESKLGRAKHRALRLRIGVLDRWQEIIAMYISRGQGAEEVLAAEDYPALADEPDDETTPES